MAQVQSGRLDAGWVSDQIVFVSVHVWEEPMGSSRPWIDTATNLIKQSREAEQPVWIDQAVESILREHPECGLGKAELANSLYKMVIDER
jgi:hypothetical protein